MHVQISQKITMSTRETRLCLLDFDQGGFLSSLVNGKI